MAVYEETGFSGASGKPRELRSIQDGRSSDRRSRFRRGGRFFENGGNWTGFFQRDSAVSRLAGTLSRVITNVPTSCLDIPTRCNTPEGLVHTKHTSTPLRYSRRKEAALSSEIIIGVARRGETRRRAWSIRTDDESVPRIYNVERRHGASPIGIFDFIRKPHRCAVGGKKGRVEGGEAWRNREASWWLPYLPTSSHRAPLVFFALIKSSCLRAASSTAILARGTPPLLCFPIFLMISPLQTRILLSFSTIIPLPSLPSLLALRSSLSFALFRLLSSSS